MLSGTVVFTMLASAACGGDDSSPAGKLTPTQTSASPAPDEIDSDDVAGIVGGTPTDVRWDVPQVPASWKSLPVGAGERQWQVGSACVVTLSQPAGLGTATEPTQEQVLDEYARRVGQAIGQNLEVTARTSSMLPLRTGNSAVTATTKVSHATLTGGDDVGGEVYAYRSGDFALTLTTVCGKGAFEETHASAFQPFISGLGVEADY
ncbi:hypothetical protein [Aeromicrobium wangtongii]|uniref:hypothetical protein n=1 Tax=Aeromicrobium wangtongii TaxID=2969247 RepID=UPI002017CC73|nr:hypothetical protein [Aeromicrobium wangtongii]MCL3819325.1 hypothetical protein [Aeromicrobium wangtongii]